MEQDELSEVLDKEWWIIIKLQVDRLGEYCSKIVVQQSELRDGCSHKEPGISVVSALRSDTRVQGHKIQGDNDLGAAISQGHSTHICDCSAPECRGTGV